MYSGNPYEIDRECFDDELFIHYLPSPSRLYNILSKEYPALNESKVSLTFDLLHAISNAVLLVIFYKWFKKIFLRAKTKFLQTN